MRPYKRANRAGRHAYPMRYHKVLPDYQCCRTQPCCLAGRYFGLQAIHPTLPAVDELLYSGNYRNVILLVLDGMGIEVLQRCLAPDGLLRSNLLQPISAVFPPTTTAATTSLISGLNPVEHGWIGWTLHFEQLNVNVDTFSNHIQFTNRAAAPFHAAATLLPFESITDKIQRTRMAQSFSISPYGDIKVDTLDALVEQIVDVIQSPAGIIIMPIGVSLTTQCISWAVCIPELQS